MNPVTLLVLIIVFVTASLHWRRAVWAALIVTIYEGAMRKWVLPGFENEIFFLKDALLTGAYVGYFLMQRRMRGYAMFRQHPANKWLLLLCGIAGLGVLNPALPTPLLGLIGLQGYVFYVPLMYMAPDLLPDERALRKLIIGIVIVAAVPLLLGPVQFASPPTSSINRYARATTDEIVTFGNGDNHVRIAGTFPYITGYTDFLSFLFVLLFAIALRQSKGRLRVLLYATLGLAFADMLMSGSRAPLIAVALCVPAVLAMSARSGKKRDIQLSLAGAMILPLLALAAVALFPDAHTAFINRARENDDASGRLAHIITNPLGAAGKAGLAGWGTGAEHQAATHVIDAGASYAPPPGYEGEWERIIIEIGPLGFLVLLSCRVSIVIYLWHASRKAHGSGAAPFVTAAFACTALTLASPLVYDHTLAIFYYFLAGFGFLATGMRAREPWLVRVPAEAPVRTL